MPAGIRRCTAWRDTGVLPDEELAHARATMAPEQYAQEFVCSFESALIGSYYGSYLDTAQDGGPHHARALGAQRTPVHTAWDLGVGDATAIWFVQPVGHMLHVIDYLEASDHGLEWYAKVLKDKPYTYWPSLLAARYRGAGLLVAMAAHAWRWPSSLG